MTQAGKKMVSLAFLATAALTVAIARELSSLIWAMFRLPLLDQWVLAPTDLIAITVGAIFFLVLVRNERAGLFVSEVFTELAKVTWPNRKETAMSSVVVVVLLALSALILFTFDLLWGSLINMMYQ